MRMDIVIGGLLGFVLGAVMMYLVSLRDVRVGVLPLFPTFAFLLFAMAGLRGDASFFTGVSWRSVRTAPAYVVSMAFCSFMISARPSLIQGIGLWLILALGVVVWFVVMMLTEKLMKLFF